MERVSITGNGGGELAKRERVAGKGLSYQRREGLKKSELECRGGLEEQETVAVFACKGLQVLVTKIFRGRVLVLIARSPKFDVYQPLAVAGISSEIFVET
jgi:hypothetical protein